MVVRAEQLVNQSGDRQCELARFVTVDKLTQVFTQADRSL